MSATPLALKFQVGARTLASIERDLVRVPLSLADALDGRLPHLAPLPADADGYLVTSLPADRAEALRFAGVGLSGFVRQRYTRYWIDLTRGFDTYSADLSANTRTTIKRKTKKLTAASGGTIDVRRFRTPAEMEEFHRIARGISALTYQERLLGGGLPVDPSFIAAMRADAEAGTARGWLLYVAGKPAAYLYCPIRNGTVIYDQVGHGPAFADLSPGAVLQFEALRDLFEERDLTRFDFTEGEGQHKRQFATDGIACVDLLLLRRSLANHAAMRSLATFDATMALGKRGVTHFGLQKLARRIRR